MPPATDSRLPVSALAAEPAAAPGAAVGDEAPSTPSQQRRRRRSSAGTRHIGSPGEASTSGGSPERTPGPGEGSPETEAQDCDLSGMLAEVEERDSRRAAAIRGVLSNLRERRPGSRGLATTAATRPQRHMSVDSEDEPMPQPRMSPPPAPVPLPFTGSSGLSREAMRGAGLENGPSHSSGQGRASGSQLPRVVSEQLPPMPAQDSAAAEADFPTAPQNDSVRRVPPNEMLAHRRLLERCSVLEERVEREQHALERTMSSLEAEQNVAREAQQALFKAESEAAYIEGSSARREAQMCTELMDLRNNHQRERDRLRGEVKRLQGSLKDMQGRARAEGERRKGATEQVDALEHQVTEARAELQRRSREGQEAKAALATLEKQLERYAELHKWVAMRCGSAMGEDEAAKLSGDATHGIDVVDDSLRRIVGRTLAVLQRRAGEGGDSGKENIPNGRTFNSARVSKKASEAVQRLAEAQRELLSAQAENEELESSMRCLQEKLSISEEMQQAAGNQASSQPALRTEHRGRIRAAEDGQKRMQKQISQLEQELQLQYERHQDERSQLSSRLASLTRAKEGNERYIQREEDAWIHAQQQSRSLESEQARMRDEVRQAQADAQDACADAVEARAMSQLSDVNRRRFEAEISEMQASQSQLALVISNHAAGTDAPVAVTAKLRYEAEVATRLQTDMLHLRKEAANAADKWHGELRQEAESCQQRLVEEADACRRLVDMERHYATEARMAETQALNEQAQLQQALQEHISAAQNMEQQFQVAMSQHQENQARVDEAKRAMVQGAMDEQAWQLRQEFAAAIEASQQQQAAEMRELHRCADEHQAHIQELHNFKQSNLLLQQRASTLEMELYQHTQGLSEQEQRICAFGRTELMAMTEEQEEQIRAHLEHDTQVRMEKMVAESVAAVSAAYENEIALLQQANCRMEECLAESCSAAEAKHEREVADLQFTTSKLERSLTEHIAALQAKRDESLQMQDDCCLLEEAHLKALADAQMQHNEEVAHLRGCHAVALAATQGEYSGECAALRQMEKQAQEACREELAGARAAQQVVEASAREAVQAELVESDFLEAFEWEALQRDLAEAKAEAHAAQHALRSEVVAAHERHAALRKELSAEIFAEVREEVRQEVHADSCSNLRRELTADLRQEISDQLRMELRSEYSARSLSSSGIGGKTNSPAGSGISPTRTRGRRPQAPRQSLNMSGASPSSIRSSPGTSSPFCVSSCSFVALPSAAGFADSVHFQEESHAPSVVQDPDLQSSCTQSYTYEKSMINKPSGSQLPTAPPSQESSVALSSAREAAGLGRLAWTDPCAAMSSRAFDLLDSVLPPPPHQGCMSYYANEGLPPPPGSWLETSPLASSCASGNRSSFRPVCLPQPPRRPLPPSPNSLEDQASAVLAAVARSRTPFQANPCAELPLSHTASQATLWSSPSYQQLEQQPLYDGC